MKILVFDNYDSFTYNLVHLVEHILHLRVDVHRNDQIPLEKVKEYDKIILSPGPGIPKEAGMLLPLIKQYASSKSILGVCLGHQAIGEAFGGKLTNLSTVYHGVATRVRVVSPELISVSRESSVEKSDPDSYRESNVKETSNSRFTSYVPRNLFEGLPEEFEAGRYHSWIVSDENFPKELEVTARDDNNYIMALQHKSFDVQGVQFHPESVLTPVGETIVRNWLRT
ncbi:MAG: aminodeoxychorismate/anthranilate synthase component II [Bacteroidetes bacterium]|nr:MAG: aminodeoxychorismate/anthranilate synthase component II [Bacteroidota bacterium]